MAAMWSSDEYKAAKEAFVLNMEGTSIAEIILVTVPLPVGLWAYAEIKALRQLRGKPTLSLVPACMYEFVLLILPQVLAQTYPERAGLLLLALVLVAGICRAIIEGRRADLPPKIQWRHDRAALLWNPVRRNYLTNYRAGVMLLSCVAILAVDFPLFPRRFAKTETYGTGLMDLGVGCFVFASGVSSAAARAYAGLSTGRGPLEPPRRMGVLAFARRVFSRCVPLVLLGGSRLLLQRGLNYQEHVSEYGVHWNFFLTLAAVQSLGPILHALVPHRALLPLSIVIIVTYQIKLSIAGLTDYVLRAPREANNFFSQNREGILGVAGYFALYLLAEQVGTLCIWRLPGGARGVKRGEGDARAAVLRLAVLDAVLWGLMLAAGGWIQPISRRLVNLTYVLWAAAHNVLVLTLLVAVDTFASVPATSHVMGALNRNQLAVFLGANLMTGAVNLGMQTIYAPPKTALMVILGYMLVLMLVFVALDRKHVALKFW